MQEEFAKNLFIYRNPVEAALKAGYSKSSASGWKTLVARSEYLQGLIRKQAKGGALLDSLLYDELTAKLADGALREVDNAKTDEDRRAALKLASDIAGKLSPTHKARLLESQRLRPDQVEKPPVLQVTNIRQLMVQVNELRQNKRALLTDKKSSGSDNGNDIIDLEPELE